MSPRTGSCTHGRLLQQETSGGLLGPWREPPHCLTGAGEAAERWTSPGAGGRLPACWGLAHPTASDTRSAGPGWASGQRPHGLYSRSVPVHLDGVDAALGPAPTLQERAVLLELQALAREVAALEDFQAEVLPVLWAPRGGGEKEGQRC